MENEIWKDIEGYDGLYKISNTGKVKSFIKKTIILKYAISSTGYKHLVLCKKGNLKTHKIHRLVAIAFIPNPNNKPCVNHIDGDKLNNNHINLEWCTIKENNNHAISIGLMNKAVGESASKSKLTEKQVIEIRRRYKIENVSINKLAIEYSVHYSSIRGIIKRKYWTHI